MSESYTITTNGLEVKDVIAQLRAVKTYPAMIKIYDRTFKLSNADECWALCVGLELGNYITEDNAI